MNNNKKQNLLIFALVIIIVLLSGLLIYILVTNKKGSDSKNNNSSSTTTTNKKESNKETRKLITTDSAGNEYYAVFIDPEDDYQTLKIVSTKDKKNYQDVLDLSMTLMSGTTFHIMDIKLKIMPCSTLTMIVIVKNLTKAMKSKLL